MKATLLILTIIVLGLIVLNGSYAENHIEEVMNDDTEMSLDSAIFAGGCFWCMEKPFEELSGVKSVVSGYTAGRTENPSYKNYEAGGHIEVVKIAYEPTVVSFKKLLEVFCHKLPPLRTAKLVRQTITENI